MEPTLVPPARGTASRRGVMLAAAAGLGALASGVHAAGVNAGAIAGTAADAGVGAGAGAGGSGIEVQAWPTARPAPVLEAPDLDGRVWRLPALRGRAVIVNFWASWCEPCRAEMPTLQQIAELHGAERLVVLAVNFKESAARAAQFARLTALSLPVLLDANGDNARRWDVRVFPSTMLIAADGRPRWRIRGEVDWSGAAAGRLVDALIKAT